MVSRWLSSWVALVTKRARLTLLLLGIVTAGCTWIAITQFHMNAELGDLITQEAPWRDDFDRFEAGFPDLVRTAVIVVSSSSAHRLERTTSAIVARLEAQPERFSAVAAPGSEPFFRDHALLYMSIDELDDMGDRLAEAQPWLSAVASDPSLRSVLNLVEDGARNEAPPRFARVLELLGDSAHRAAAGEDAAIAWTDELFALDAERHQLIYVKAAQGREPPVTDADVVAALRDMVAELGLDEGSDPHGLTVRLTGEIVLQHEELEAAVGGVTLAGWLSLILLFCVLIVGVRSGKIIVATFTMLAIGIVWTSAYAMLTVGEYNTLSVVFIVMFFGLGVDFALHFSLRYQEAISRDGEDVAAALGASVSGVGRAISLCTVTTALGFLGFWPTAYQGLADLGVISAGGMAVAWFLTFTFLPAFYALVGPPRPHQMDLPTSEGIVRWLFGHRRWVVLVVAVGGVSAAAVASRSHFDYSVLALKDPTSESMRTLRVLQREGLATDYQLAVVAPAPVDAGKLEQLAEVEEVLGPDDLLPVDVEDKLWALADLQQMLWTALYPGDGETPPDVAALRRQGVALAEFLASGEAELAEGTALDFRAGLAAMAQAEDSAWLTWQRGVIDNLQEELAWLRRAVAVAEVEFTDLPEDVRARVVNAEGQMLSVITPAEDIAPVAALSAFISAVRDVEPNATGRPVIEWGVGGIVISAFQQALLFAIGAIVLVLFLVLRNARLVMLILLPLLLTTVFTLALSVVFDVPINMANILVIPLIFGLGVDNGIHVVDRYLGEGDMDHLMHSSTPRAVMLSTLTTIGAFAALSLSPHAGTASIGLLLTVAIGFLLVFTVFLLPVLLNTGRGE